jgi:hypothetical protein
MPCLMPKLLGMSTVLNERIKELAEESGLVFGRDYLRYEELKFAELIIKECIVQGGHINAGDGGYRLGTQEAYEAFVKNRSK